MSSAEQAKSIISKNNYLVLATISESGEPWNAPVFFAYDAQFNLYWGSYAGAQHSLNIRANGKAYIVIFDSTVEAGKGEGVYVRALIQEMKGEKEIREVHKLLWDRHEVPYWKVEQFFGEAPIRMYKAVPQKVWMNVGGEVQAHYVDKREEVPLI